jgi:hypothetical protein
VVLVDAVGDLPGPDCTTTDFVRTTVTLHNEDVAGRQSIPLEFTGLKFELLDLR